MGIRVRRESLLSILLLCTVLQISQVEALPRGPQVPIPSEAIVKDCLEYPQANDSLSENHIWKLTCPIEDFRKRIQKESKSWPSHVSFLAGQVLFDEFLKFRANFLVNTKRSQHLERPEGFFWEPKSDADEKTKVLGPDESSQSSFINASVDWFDDMDLLLRPLFDSKASSRKYGEDKSTILKKEAGYLWFRFVNASMRYGIALREMNSVLNFMFDTQKDRSKILAVLIDIVKQDPSALGYFKELIIKNLEKIPQKDDRRITSSDFDGWLFLWKLKGQNLDAAERGKLLDALRRMWILFPTKEHKIQIRKLAISLQVSRSFIGPSIRQLKLSELLTYAEKQIDYIEGDEALVTMRQVLRLPNNLVDKDELWKALVFHLRLLRIMDQRHHIPAILKRYLVKGHFVDIPKKAEEREEFFDRMYQVGKWRWSYDTQLEAVKIFDQIISLNRAWGTDYKLDDSYYVRARIAEQSGDKIAARLFFDQAIQELERNQKDYNDLYVDLRWRRFFNSLDLAAISHTYKGISDELDQFKSKLNWKEDGSRWYFWKAQAFLLEGQQKQAIEYFEKTYEHEPLGYFSSLAGLELIKLGKEPSGWKLDSAEKYWKGELDVWEEPSFAEIFSIKNLKYKKNQDVAWARIYGLASIRRFKDLGRYIPSLERRAYVYAMASNQKFKRRDKRRLLLKIAWLRLAVGDNIGALRTGELARITFEGDIGAEELAYLYPLPFKELIHKNAIENHIDPWHVTSLIRQESAFNYQARSSANALGLMQIIPPVAEAEAKELKIANFEPEMLLNPEMSVKVGTYHLSKLFTLFESSIIVSTAGYNAGRPPAYDWLEHYFNPLSYAFIDRISFSETRGYVRSILRNYVNYSRIYNDAVIDPEKLLKMPILMPKAKP